MDLRVDPARQHLPETGIPVRALGADGKWASVDIAWLDQESLTSWLRSRGGDNPWAESVVAILLGHPHGPTREVVTSACPACGVVADRETYDIGSGPELACSNCEWCWGAVGQALKPVAPPAGNDER